MLQYLAHIYRDMLLNDVIPFWMKHGVDSVHGGFLTCLNRDGSLIDSDKGVWQQGRATWLFGELFNNVERRAEWLRIAEQAVDFISRHCFDSQDGRMWFQVTQDGRPLRKRRYAFSESFAAIAYGEMALATGRDEHAAQARRLFKRFVDHVPQAKYTEVRPLRGIGVPMITLNTAQELRDSIQLRDADHFIDQSIDDIRRYHVHEDLEVVLETAGPDGSVLDHFDGRTLNPGHAIECAWFVMSEGQHRQDSDLVDLGCRMLDWMWARGWDEKYGGLLYFVDLDGLPVQEYWHDMKFWWPHNEALIATALAWSLTKEPKYAQWHQMMHDWCFDHFADPEHGEWFGYLHRDGRLSVSSKGNLWKGPFHLPRMLLKCWKILAASAS